MKKAIIYIIVFLAIQLMATCLVAAVSQLLPMAGLQGLQSTETTIVGMVLFSIVTIGVFCRMKWAAPSRDYLLSRPWGVLFWSVVAALGAVIPSMALQEAMPELPNLIEQEMGDLLLHRGGYLVVCLLAPLTEELVCRGAVLRALLKWRPAQRWGMIALSALLFALIHLNPAQMPHAFIIGLLLGWMYERTGSIVPGVAYHWANNTVAYVLFRVYPDPDYRLIDIFSGQQRAVAAAIVFSLFILLPAIYQLNMRLRRV